MGNRKKKMRSGETVERNEEDGSKRVKRSRNTCIEMYYILQIYLDIFKSPFIIQLFPFFPFFYFAVHNFCFTWILARKMLNTFFFSENKRVSIKTLKPQKHLLIKIEYLF